jgi:hypothetical protein
MHTEQTTYSVTLRTGGLEYHPYYPRFLVTVHANNSMGTVEVVAISHSTKDNEREQLEHMSVKDVYLRALQKAKANEWFHAPNT